MSPSPTHPHDRPVQYYGLGGLRCLAGGVDALYLSAHGEIPDGLTQVLEGLRAEAAEVQAPVPFGEGWWVAGHGWGKYCFCLDHERGRLGLTTSQRLPALRFQPLAEALHGLGPAEVVAWVDRVAGELVGPVRWG